MLVLSVCEVYFEGDEHGCGRDACAFELGSFVSMLAEQESVNCMVWTTYKAFEKSHAAGRSRVVFLAAN